MFTLDIVFALLTLSLMEIVLGIDNIIFISILVAKVPSKSREKIRKLGILLALGSRLLLLFSISWVMGLTQALFEVFSHPFSGRDLILLGGGLFLITKATLEIHSKVEDIEYGESQDGKIKAKSYAAQAILLQIMVLDIVFSLDSVITAVGMANDLWVMVVAMVIAVGVMLVSAKSIGDFVDSNPSLKILALAFLLLIGVMLVAESFGAHVNKGFIYFAMAFAVGIELLNMRYRSNKAKVKKNLA